MVVGFTPFSSTNKTDLHDITEILLSGVKYHKPNQINQFSKLCHGNYIIRSIETVSIVWYFLFFILIGYTTAAEKKNICTFNSIKYRFSMIKKAFYGQLVV